MKRPAVFFDRDNTLIVNDGYLGDPGKVVLVEGAAEAISRVRTLGYAVVVFSNQSGVARGMFGEDDVHRVNARLDELLVDAQPHAIIDRHEFCPFHPEGTVPEYKHESDLRKPKPGMIYQAADKLALDLSRSWVIGDAPRDIESGKAAGCRTIWYKDTRLPQSMAARELMLTVPDAVVSSLKEATDVIAREALIRHASPPEPTTSAPAPVAQQISPAVSQAYSPPASPREMQGESDPEPSLPEPEPTLESFQPSRSPVPRSVSSAKPIMQALAQKRATAAAAGHQPSHNQPASLAHANPIVASTARLEELAEQILQALEKRGDAEQPDFSISKLLAGIVQIVALAALVLAYMRYDNSVSVLLIAVFLQLFTIALLIMGRQK
jgi:D-glycero-D-manno-heptose 1,7-bisphosphate phosphatase